MLELLRYTAHDGEELPWVLEQPDAGCWMFFFFFFFGGGGDFLIQTKLPKHQGLGVFFFCFFFFLGGDFPSSRRSFKKYQTRSFHCGDFAQVKAPVCNIASRHRGNNECIKKNNN